MKDFKWKYLPAYGLAVLGLRTCVGGSFIDFYINHKDTILAAIAWIWILGSLIGLAVLDCSGGSKWYAYIVLSCGFISIMLTSHPL